MYEATKAFLQIIIYKSEKMYLRFLRRFKNGKLIIMQMKILPFGIVSAPVILVETIIDTYVMIITIRKELDIFFSTIKDDNIRF